MFSCRPFVISDLSLLKHVLMTSWNIKLTIVQFMISEHDL